MRRAPPAVQHAQRLPAAVRRAAQAAAALGLHGLVLLIRERLLLQQHPRDQDDQADVHRARHVRGGGQGEEGFWAEGRSPASAPRSGRTWREGVRGLERAWVGGWGVGGVAWPSRRRARSPGTGCRARQRAVPPPAITPTRRQRHAARAGAERPPAWEHTRPKERRRRRRASRPSLCAGVRLTLLSRCSCACPCARSKSWPRRAWRACLAAGWAPSSSPTACRASSSACCGAWAR